MHTTKINDTTFHHSDYQGDIKINRPGTTSDYTQVLEVPMEDLIEFIGGYLRDRLISDIEQMDGRELLMAAEASVLTRKLSY